jgi:acetyl-CoA carboxylase beta subunit
MPDFDGTVVGRRRWTAHHDPHVRAAVGLLIDHETWIRRADFQRACIEKNAREAWINWQKAREFADSGSVASTSEMAILDLAVAIGENRYKFSIMGPANSRMIAQAVARALGEDWP